MAARAFAVLHYVQVLRLMTGSDRFGASTIVRAGSSFVEPGVVPSEDVRLRWRTFKEAADLESRQMGRQIGTLAWLKATSYFRGDPP